MSRTIRKPAPPPKGVVADAANNGDTYASQLIKLLPTETVSLFVFLDGTLASVGAGAGADASTTKVLFGVVVVALLLGTPAYLWRLQGVRALPQLALSTVGFAIWVLATSRCFAEMFPEVPGVVGAVLVPLFTFAAPLLVPRDQG